MINYLFAYLALLFIFMMTIFGGGMVFFINKTKESTVSKLILGISVGVMIATSVFALLVPAMQNANSIKDTILILSGFSAGCVVLLCMDKFFKTEDNNSSDGSLMFAMTLHNIPEGVTVGLAFSLLIRNPENNTLLPAAVILAIGIGIQNFPESMALAAIFKSNGKSKIKAFIFTVLSGVVEPIFGIITLFMYELAVPIMPFLLSYAAGTMLHVTVEELIPDLQCNNRKNHIATIGIMTGILLMLGMEMVQ